MKSNRHIVYCLCLIMVLSARPGIVSSQDQTPRLYLMGDFLVDASRAGDYEAALKELISHL